MWGASIGWGKRLKWPDDYFQFQQNCLISAYILKDWSYLYIKLNNGNKCQPVIATYESNVGT